MENRGKRFLAAKTPRGFVERRELGQKSREEKRRGESEIDTRADESLAIPAIPKSELLRESLASFSRRWNLVWLHLIVQPGDTNFPTFFSSDSSEMIVLKQHSFAIFL